MQLAKCKQYLQNTKSDNFRSLYKNKDFWFKITAFTENWERKVNCQVG